MRVLQIYECLNVALYGTSIEFGVIDNKDKTFSNFVKGKSKFYYSNKISNKKFLLLVREFKQILIKYFNYCLILLVEGEEKNFEIKTSQRKKQYFSSVFVSSGDRLYF